MLLVLAGNFLLSRLGAQNSTLHLQNFLPKAYKEDVISASPQNWDLAQGPEGNIYATNFSGILEYDGSHWRLLDHGKIKSAPSFIAVDAAGTLYAGGKGDLGYFRPDASGNLTFHSLKNDLPAAFEKQTLDVQDIHCLEQATYFVGSDWVLKWDPGQKQLSYYPSQTNITVNFVHAGQLYVLTKGGSFYTLHASGWKALDTFDFQPFPSPILAIPQAESSPLNKLLLVFPDALLW
ncbi:MAG: hypothetical protein D6730_01930, partial [Bacteroidetes bacterium]